MIRKTYKYRIYPNSEQKEYFAKCFGCVRFFYNKSLADMIEDHKVNGGFNNITPATYKNEFPFLKEVDSMALCFAQKYRNHAFDMFFAGKAGKPKYKTKRSEQTYTTNNHKAKNTIRFSDNDRYIRIPKCERIRIRKHRDFKGLIKTATVIKTSDDKYYMSIVVETEDLPLEKTTGVIGIDVGVNDLLIGSNGIKYKNNKYHTRLEKKISRETRRRDKMIIGSNNRNKQNVKIAKLYKRISNQRNDYLHKISRHIINENQVICVENLIVNTMSKNNEYNKSRMDASMSRLLHMLEYKAEWYSRTFVKVPHDYPSSQLCSKCGYKNSNLKNLSIRSWICPECGSIHDRDVNAAKNILNKGIEMLVKDGVHPDSLFMLGSLESSSKKSQLNCDMPLAVR